MGASVIPEGLQWAQFGLSALGGLFGGLGAGKDRAFAQQQFGLQFPLGQEAQRRAQQLNEGQFAAGLADKLSTNSLRDRLLAILGQVAGSGGPAQFSPWKTLGGINPQAMVPPSSISKAGLDRQGIYENLLERMGYSPDNSHSYISPAFDPQITHIADPIMGKFKRQPDPNAPAPQYGGTGRSTGANNPWGF